MAGLFEKNPRLQDIVSFYNLKIPFSAILKGFPAYH
jgi:hypothetical protein